MNIIDVKRNQHVQLTIPAGRPILTMSGDLFTNADILKVLGFWGTGVRLSRIGDKKKLIALPEDLHLSSDWIS